MATVALINIREWFFLKEIPPPRHWLLVLFSFGFDYFCRRRCSLFEKEILWINWLFWFHEFFCFVGEHLNFIFQHCFGFWSTISIIFLLFSFVQLGAGALSALLNCEMTPHSFPFVICDDKIINVKFVVNVLPQ